MSKTADTIRKHKAVERLETSPDIFVELRPGWINPSNEAHCFGEETITDALRTLRTCVPCACAECKQLMAGKPVMAVPNLPGAKTPQRDNPEIPHKAEKGDSFPKTIATILHTSADQEGAGYTIRFPDGSEAELGDAQDAYWALADILDGLNPSVPSKITGPCVKEATE